MKLVRNLNFSPGISHCLPYPSHCMACHICGNILQARFCYGSLASDCTAGAQHENCQWHHAYRVYSNRMQAKKIISNLVCAQLESEQFQEVNFLLLIRCCVVIDLHNTALHDDE